MSGGAGVAFGSVVVVGGGCYGSYYVRQLHRARQAGKARWDRLVVVDRDPACAVVAARPDARIVDLAAFETPGPAVPASPAPEIIVAAEWPAFFAAYLGAAAADPAKHSTDTIVPSPLMPHLLFDWVRQRAESRAPGAVVASAPDELPGIPWQRAGDQATRYVSYATWMCPINCIEPARCPHTRGPRDWSLHDALPARSADVALMRVTHRVFGVGMIDVADVLEADRRVAERLDRVAYMSVATASHCHGAVAQLRRAGVSRTSPGSEI